MGSKLATLGAIGFILFYYAFFVHTPYISDIGRFSRDIEEGDSCKQLENTMEKIAEQKNTVLHYLDKGNPIDWPQGSYTAFYLKDSTALFSPITLVIFCDQDSTVISTFLE